jgi:hypothetical protein
MRCDEIRERLVEVLYDECGTSPDSVEMRDHLRECSSCRKDFEDLKQTQKTLHLWKDEPPLRSTAITRREASPPSGFHWKYLRYAAIAAMFVMALLALANTQITWNREGFSFSTRLFSTHETENNFYTKAELRDILKRALDESELRTNETNYLMMLKILDTVDQDRWTDLRLTRHQTPQARTRN